MLALSDQPLPITLGPIVLLIHLPCCRFARFRSGRGPELGYKEKKEDVP